MTIFHGSTGVQPSTGDTLIDNSDTTHIVCCKHPNLALCGIDTTDATWAEPDEMEDCVVCTDLHEESPGFCPARSFCPLFVVPA